MAKKTTAVLLLVTLLVTTVGWLLWRSLHPVYYQLQVVNNSLKVVDQVRLFGRGVVQEAVVNDIEPGAVGVVTAELRVDGDLRFEVIQGLNSIDTFIEQDIGKLAQRQQRLEINANNHFIISP